ncbi:MAG TPA: ABC transporter ATP-binding protein [Candidatus Dormibacteraeota bacterium]|nr:ABC transporter ATP-binding protein [Candidatus Dormibacteraeota bacterium]
MASEPTSPLPGHVRSLLRIAAAAFRAEPLLVVASLVLTPLGGLAGPVAALWLRSLADAALDRSTPPAITAAIGLVATLAGAELLTVLQRRLQRDLQDRLASVMQPWFAGTAAGISGIEHLERPEHVDRLEVVRDNSWYLCWSFETLAEVLTVAVQLAATAVLLARVEPLLLLFALLGIPAGVAARAAATGAGRATEAMAGRERGVRHLLGLVSVPEPAAELRVFGLSAEVIRRIGALHGEHDRGILGAVWRGALFQTVAALTLAAGYGGALAVVGLAVLAHRAQPGDLLLTALLLASLNGVVLGAAAVLAAWLQMQAVVRRMVWLDDRLADDRRRLEGTSTSPERGVVRLERVSFTYPGAGRQVLRGIDLELRPGRIVALVGENGAGKTSLAKLLLRLYEPTGGRITVGGVPLDRIEPASWRRLCSGAFQDVTRFETSLGEAVALGRLQPEAAEEEVLAALGRAGAGDLASNLPGGLGAQLGARWPGGVDLSGGQWQKLGLARCLLRGSPALLILDEPTSALDADTEHAIFRGFAEAGRRAGMATLLISHRFSTTREADLIAVLEGGRITELGGHAELMGRQGTYARLYRIQAGAYA